MNESIKLKECRLIDENGGQVGIIDVGRALVMAKEKGLDLIEVSPQANPPVCRLMNYGKFLYEQKKKTKKPIQTETKIIQFRPDTEKHDIDFKTKHIIKFLTAKNKVKLVVKFKGRELAHPEIARNLLDEVAKQVSDLSNIEKAPNMDGRNMIMILAPK